MRLNYLKFLKILNRAGKRVVSLLGAVALIALNVVPALASHVDISNMSREDTQDYVHGISSTFIIPDTVSKSELDNITDVISVTNNKIPARYNSSNEVKRFGTRLENIVNGAPCDLSDIAYDVFIFAGSQRLVLTWFYYVKSGSASFNVLTYNTNYNKFEFNEKCFYGVAYFNFDESSQSYSFSTVTSSCVDYVALPNNSILIDTDSSCLYYSNNNSTPALNLDNSNLFESPEPWLYDVSYSPVLTDELSDLQYIDVTVSLQDSTVKFLEQSSSNYSYRLDFLPYISGVSASDNLAQSYDYAYAVSPYRGTFYDKYTVQAGSWGNNHVVGTYNKDKCLGTSIVYSLNSANNYTATVRISIPDTSLVSGNQYYFNVVGIMSSDLWYKTADKTVPNRGIFRTLYDDYSSGNLSDWSDDGLQSFRVMDSSAFTMSGVLKKTSKNYNVDGGLMSNTTNALNSNPSIIKDVAGSGNDLAFSEVEDYNNQQAEDYVESAPDKELSGFSLSGLLSILNYSDEFLGFLSYGFSILPIQIWSLIKFSIVAVIFVGIVKTAVLQ